MMSVFSKFSAVAFATILISGCGGRSGVTSETEVWADAESDAVGLLNYSDPSKCPFSTGCGSEFSLMNDSLTRFTPLYGRVDAQHKGLVIAVQGKTTQVDKAHREFLRDAGTGHAIKLNRYRLLSKIPYHPFLVEKSTEHTTGKYGCDLLWDKSYRWSKVDDRIHLTVRMTNTFYNADPKPFLELSYDGETGHLLKEDPQPWGIDPCKY